ncbi:MAG: complex I NDUFA9 subunit family protein [Thermodesulfovibrionales bacterium]
MIFIAGGTGFIGQHLLKALKEGNFKVRCLARTEERAVLCRKSGFEAVTGDITDRESLRNSLDAVETVVHLVGIIEEKGEMTFQRVHVEGTRNLVDEAKRGGVKHIFYQSALGASLNSDAAYQRTKAEAEEIVKNSGIPYTIFRPSLVIGEKDGFTERLKELIKLGPFVPVPGTGEAKFQPIYVGDWVRCFLSILGSIEAIGKTYEFGGPEHLTYNDLILQLMEVMGVRKPLIHIPLSLARAGIPLIGLGNRIGKVIGKKIPTVTAEQLMLLERDNICDLDSVKRLFGFEPIKYKEALRMFIRGNA